jgi:hypothetical protein
MGNFTRDRSGHADLATWRRLWTYTSELVGKADLPDLHEQDIDVRVTIQALDCDDSISTRSSRITRLLRAELQIIVQNNRFGNLLHGLAPLLALPLHGSIRIFLAYL